MAAMFREVSSFTGVDIDITGNGGIVLAEHGTNQFFLVDGPKHQVQSDNPAVKLHELNASERHNALTGSAAPTGGVASTAEPFKTRALRMFEITGRSVAGLDKAHITAKGAKGEKDLVLKVMVIRQRPVSLAIRPVYLGVDDGRSVPYTKGSTDTQAMVDYINAVFVPQANVKFKLIDSSPATIQIDGDSWMPDPGNKFVSDWCVSQKAKGADLTMLLVRQAYDGHPVRGVTAPDRGYALISDQHTVNTLPHEAGHFIGSVNANGKFSVNYGHWDGQDLLMSYDGFEPGKKIPYSKVVELNKGYTKDP